MNLQKHVLATKPSHKLSISEYCQEDPQKGFPHTIGFHIKESSSRSKLTYSLSGTYGISIDCFQRLREIGYLGNPASFTGTYMSYIAHEALYFNYEQDVFNTSNASTYDEVVIFDEAQRAWTKNETSKYNLSKNTINPESKSYNLINNLTHPNFYFILKYIQKFNFK